MKRMLASARRGSLTNADATHARSLIRGLFALIEAAMYALKVDAVMTAEELGKPRSYVEEALALEVRFELDDRGEIVQRQATIALERNIKFAFLLCADVFEVPSPLDTSSEWWHALKRSLRVRDRLMHPRSPEDIEVVPSDVVDALTAERGFMKAVMVLLEARASAVRAAT